MKNTKPWNVGTAVKAGLFVLAVWLAYQTVGRRDFTAPSTFADTAPVLR